MMHDLFLFLDTLIQSLAIVLLAVIGLLGFALLLFLLAARYPHSNLAKLVRLTIGLICLTICFLATLEFFNPIVAALPGADLLNWTGSGVIDLIAGALGLINLWAGFKHPATHTKIPAMKNVTPEKKNL